MKEKDFEKLQKDKILKDIREIIENIDKIDTQINMYDELIKNNFFITKQYVDSE